MGKEWHPEELRKLTAQADYVALQTARLRGELVPLAAVESFFGRALMSFRQQMEDTLHTDDSDDPERQRQLDDTLRALSHAFDTAVDGLLRTTEGTGADGGEVAAPTPAPQRMPMGRSPQNHGTRGQRQKPKGVTKVFNKRRAASGGDAGINH